MQRLAGAIAILLGCALLVWDPVHNDPVVFSVSATHGAHIVDLIGLASVLTGITAMWTAPPR